MLDQHSRELPADVHLQSFSVRYDYPVYFTRDLFDLKNRCLCNALSSRKCGQPQRVAFFVDEGVMLACPRLLHQHSNGEHILRELSVRGIDRQSFAIGIGGGAMLDAAGFAAAIFHRGVRHIRCPTTGTCERRTPLKAPLRPSGTAPSGQKAACRTRRRLPWSSSLSKARRKIGAASTAITSCQN